MKLTINTVAHYLPEKYSKYAEDTYRYKDQPVLSFPFSVEDLPTDTHYISFSFIDHDAVPVCGFSWIHWLVANVKTTGTTIYIPENFSLDLSDGIQGTNSFASVFVGETDPKLTQHYVGPTPPDKDHHYTLTVYASKEKLNLTPGFFYNDMRNSLTNNILAKTSIEILAKS
ncbi:YbhB/YbcL family Raf kinase inhibitor-like protein [Pseudolactococcus plantarum]|uniref:YbhB/YbcL family Raf kinase inhibitor-like protein n=1 Tax=Pseudolactococcus plantarum TaxID=1365 RepID=A0A2A5RWW9_9LACT|nr:YbhB/YbcL family Raf kinase inhibitor-like protein [Lactococcus plantarum]PCS05747.1 hypothetical protein RU87_GL000457 [Lactococcus plantarum]HCN47892.1 YbhB/YbcL family Raf kinase inhibitor-like protein [Chryseobacterium sp.]